MIEWSEQHRQIQTMFRKWVDAEVVPRREALEFGDEPPYEVLRSMMSTFGVGEMALAKFHRDLEREKAGTSRPEKPKATTYNQSAADAAAMRIIPTIELSRYSPGMITALGVSIGLTANAILRRGTIAQKERFVPDLLTLDKVGAWAITEPGSGSDAFGAMRATAVRDGETYVLNGQKTFITNGPYADTIVYICKLDDGSPAERRKIVSFVLDGDTPAWCARSPCARWACTPRRPASSSSMTSACPPTGSWARPRTCPPAAPPSRPSAASAPAWSGWPSASWSNA